MQKTILIIITTALVGLGAFYGGTQYSQNKAPQSAGFAAGNFNFAELRNLSSEERQQRIEEMGMAGAGFGAGPMQNRDGIGIANGEIISQDDQSITIELRDGGSKIVFYSDNTAISKFVDGNLTDLAVGQSVMVNGSANEYGSITAESIQLRTELLP